MVSDSNSDRLSGKDLLSASGLGFQALTDLSKDVVVLIALDGAVRYVSPASQQIFGWDAESFSTHLSDLVYLGDPNQEAEALHRILSGKGDPAAPLPQADLQLRSAFGPLIWAEVNAHLLKDAANAPVAFAVFFRSIAKRKELESLLEAASQTDPLTGLCNRRTFEENLKREWAVAMREKTHTSLIKVSLDRFESFVEQFGETAAEECLSKVAKTLKETARRPADIVARTATSEFSLLLPRTHEMGAETISAYIHVAIQDLAIPNPHGSAGGETLTASVGAACAVAEQTGVSESSEFILAAAENCVFLARQEGGNRVKTVMDFLTR
ncbi:MAG: diguanylate cyclase [Roseibium sp.]|nr:diguanylate cyclase [Roseibium sp.]